jgi:hypothetical protein
LLAPNGTTLVVSGQLERAAAARVANASAAKSSNAAHARNAGPTLASVRTATTLCRHCPVKFLRILPPIEFPGLRDLQFAEPEAEADAVPLARDISRRRLTTRTGDDSDRATGVCAAHVRDALDLAGGDLFRAVLHVHEIDVARAHASATIGTASVDDSVFTNRGLRAR